MCEFCDSSDPVLSHPITNAIDGTHSFWQSPSLAVDSAHEFVTIDIDLGQVRNYSVSINHYFDQSTLFKKLISQSELV
jgi:hypothetical protein